MNTKDNIFRIGYARMISNNLLATLVDVQSTIVTDLDGVILCWVHAHTETINLSKDISGELLEELKTVSIIADKVNNYRLVNDGNRLWGIISKFRYPEMAVMP